MNKENKDTYVKVRTTETFKKGFIKKLEDDGITQSDFFNACMMNYLGIKTSIKLPKNTVKNIENKK